MVDVVVAWLCGIYYDITFSYKHFVNVYLLQYSQKHYFILDQATHLKPSVTLFYIQE